MGQHGELTPQHLAFIDAYIAGNSGTYSATIAGFSVKCAATTACRLLKKAHIKAEIARRREVAVEELELQPEKVLQRLLVEVDGLGPDTNADARLKAAELAGKYLGMFIEKREVEHSGEVGGTGRFEVVIVDP